MLACCLETPMSDPSTTPAHYTAAQIATALGRPRRIIQRVLAEIPDDGKRIVRGNETRCWQLASLPESIRGGLLTVAQQRGYRDAEHLLNQPDQKWQPALPLTDCSDETIAKAVKLRDALGVALARRNDCTLGSSELEAIGLADYQRAFGHTTKVRSWRELFHRTLDRAGAEDNFNRLELYLDERPARKTSVAPVLADADKLHALKRTLDGCRNPAALTESEKQAAWLAALETFDARIEVGDSSKAVKEEILGFLTAFAPCLASNRNALRVAFQRKYDRWQTNERKAAALRDGRGEENRSRRNELSEDDRDILIAHTVMACGGRISQGIRECMERGLVSEALQSRLIHNPTSKSYVPSWLRERIQHDVAMLEDNHHGPRRAKLNGAHISRYWGCVPALDWYCMDDATLPIYFYVPDGQGWFTLMRGQFLLAIDTRSTCILGFALMPERNYNARVIRTLITRVCDEYGLPRSGFYFENGIWKDSRILTGDPDATPFSWQETELGLREFGLRFMHSRLPRSKPVERVLGALQDLMEGDRGYAGRDEVHDGFESFKRWKLKIESKAIDPRGVFYTFEQWENRLSELCDQYNAAEQGGKMTGGLSPEGALETFRDKSNPGIRFDGALRLFFAHHRRPIRVTSNGITLRFGKQVYNYRNEETGKLRGQMVISFFNPDCPEVLAVTDMALRNPFCVARAQDVPAMDAPPELLSRELARCEEHMSYSKTRYRVIKSKYQQQFRPTLVDSVTRDAGEQLTRQIDEVKIESNRREAELRKARKISARLRMDATPGLIHRPGVLKALEDLDRLLHEDETAANEP
jgi:hypothetical protein